jgi:hypothetical protein
MFRAAKKHFYPKSALQYLHQLSRKSTEIFNTKKKHPHAKKVVTEDGTHLVKTLCSLLLVGKIQTHACKIFFRHFS